MKAVVGSEGGSWFGVMAMGTLPVHGIEIKLVSHRRHHIIAPDMLGSTGKYISTLAR